MYRFSKYHGCHNTFTITELDLLQESGLFTPAEADSMTSKKEVPILSKEAVKVCEANDTDGFIIVRKEPALEMIFYNRDGSIAPMCGNGIRCFAHYCRDNEIMMKREYPVITGAGEMVVHIVDTGAGESGFAVQINMGDPILSPLACGISSDSENFLNVPIETSHGTFDANTVFMGTVHTVIWVPDFDFPYEEVGAEISENPVFTEKTNVNFVRAVDRENFEIKTYERGVGLTDACGTGACASFVIGRLQDHCATSITASLPGGDLTIEGGGTGVMMTGPSEKYGEGMMP